MKNFLQSKKHMKKFLKRYHSFFLLFCFLLTCACNSGDVKEFKRVKDDLPKDSIKVKKLKIQTH